MKTKVKDLKDYIKKAEVGKVIDKSLNRLDQYLKKELDKSPNHNSRRLAILYSAIDELNRIKQKLGIK